MTMNDLRDPTVPSTDDTALLARVRNIPNVVLITIHDADDDVYSTYALATVAALDVFHAECDACDVPFRASDPVLYYADIAFESFVHARHHFTS